MPTILAMNDKHQQDLIEAIRKAREREPGLVILTHHYQRPEVVGLGDFVGDSFALAKWAAERTDARRIVFCGVRFMAEGARVLGRADQEVLHPDPWSGCPMADMADAPDTERAIDLLAEATGRPPLLVTYMNSSAEVKAVAGRTGGAVCTSSNAGRVLTWALAQARPILFVPDEFLGRNTLLALGVDANPPVFDPTIPDGGVAPQRLATAPVLLWKGYCHVHTHFTVAMVEQARRNHPGCRVLVHPECDPAVVRAADGSGSTEYLVREVTAGQAGSTFVVGTEVNLVMRLAATLSDRTVLPLARSLCPNMYRITLDKVLQTLTAPRPDQVVNVPPDTIADARVALQTMLAIGKG